MKKILFTIALQQEAKILKEELKNFNIPFKIDFLLTGVGNYNVIYKLKDYIDKKGKPDFIVNIGVCGCKNSEFKDFFQVYRIENFQNNKESICPIYINFLFLKGIYSSEKVITGAQDLVHEDFVDMESYGIDFVCSHENIPYIIIKKPFDIVSISSKNVSINELQNSLKNFNYNDLFNKIEEFFNKNENINFEKEINILKEKYRLTFSETNILRNFINKKISFGENFLDIYGKLDSLDKKDFLNVIKN